MGQMLQTGVFFGAHGDLAQRKLYPALYQLYVKNLLEQGFRVLAVGRRTQSRSEFVEFMRAALERYVGEPDHAAMQSLLDKVDYLPLDLHDEAGYQAIGQWLARDKGAAVPAMFYLATAASLYEPICRGLAHSECITQKSRVVVEKPIGYDFKSSCVINDQLARHFKEQQIYRIDHYLGKETVQNLLALRFANALFASQWNQQHISHVEITVAETIGIEGRWDYFDQAGQMRDMVQSHVLQLLCLIAMDPPNNLGADAIRDEKLKVLKALRRISSPQHDKYLIRGQYAAGEINGQRMPGYLEEEGARTGSQTATFVAVKAHIDNWRWSGVPFYLRTGKRLPRKLTQITVHFRPTAHFIFDQDQKHIAGNKLVIRIQPDEGIQLYIVTKEPGLNKGVRLRRSPLQISLASDAAQTPDAYERLLWEVLIGDQYLFVRRDEVEWAWRWCDEVASLWEADADPFRYESGTWGPAQSISLMTTDGRRWHEDF